MAKKDDRALKVIAGIALIAAAIIGIGQVLTVLLVILGAWLIYDGLKR